jgi:hypothetical protein
MTNAARLAVLLAAVLTGSFAAPAGASTQGPIATLFQSDRFQGPSLQVILPTNDLNAMGFTKIGSFWIGTGTWQFCTQPNFKGTCIVAKPGRYSSSAFHGFAPSIRSLQPVDPSTPATKS